MARKAGALPIRGTAGRVRELPDRRARIRTDEGVDHKPGRLRDQATRVPTELLPCVANEPELWFAESPSDVERAKALCQECPVRELCLQGALERREPWGVWGGQLLLRGNVIPRKRGRGRPRKETATSGASWPADQVHDHLRHPEY